MHVESAFSFTVEVLTMRYDITTQGRRNIEETSARRVMACTQTGNPATEFCPVNKMSHFPSK